MSEEDARRRELQARNEGLRSQIDNMMSDLRRRTDELQERQAEVAGTVHEVTSEDRMVTARVDATGTLQELTLAPKAFERTSPERLARTITSVIREASGAAQQQLHEKFEPMTRDVPDLSDILPGAPSFQDFLTNPLGAPPDPAAERAKRGGTAPPPPTSNPRNTPVDDYDDEDEPPGSFMVGGR